MNGTLDGFSGLQNTLHPENDFGVLNDHLMQVNRPDGRPGLVPKDNPISSQSFYNALIGSVKYYGFDFAKIDYQMRDLEWYIGTDNAVAATVTNLQSMEKAAHRALKGLINCMAHNNVCIFNTPYSAVTRCSVDYKVGNAEKGREHIWQSFQNTLWQCQTAWGDHDMFHSCDPDCGRMMAVSNALSGGPVYLSDAPKDFIAGYIRPLCYEDGLLLRPLAPAAPLPDSIFKDPTRMSQAYRVIAPLEGETAAVAVYNLTAGDMLVHSAIGPDDYTHAGAMVQPYVGRYPGSVGHWLDALTGQVGQLAPDINRQVLPGRTASETVIKLTQKLLPCRFDFHNRFCVHVDNLLKKSLTCFSQRSYWLAA